MEARPIDVDLAAILEAVYDVERDARSWIAGILQRLEPSISDGVGLFGFEYTITSVGRLQIASLTCVDCSEAMGRELPALALEHGPEYCAAASEVRDWVESESARHLRAMGVLDSWRIAGKNPGNRGLAVIVNRRFPGSPTDVQRAALTRVAKHFAAAHRLRERLVDGELAGSSEALRCGPRPVVDAHRRCVLSPREHQVLALATLGRPNKQIAFELGIGHSTVRVLLTRAAKKLDARDHADLLRRFEGLRGTSS